MNTELLPPNANEVQQKLWALYYQMQRKNQFSEQEHQKEIDYLMNWFEKNAKGCQKGA